MLPPRPNSSTSIAQGKMSKIKNGPKRCKKAQKGQKCSTSSRGHSRSSGARATLGARAVPDQVPSCTAHGRLAKRLTPRTGYAPPRPSSRRAASSLGPLHLPHGLPPTSAMSMGPTWTSSRCKNSCCAPFVDLVTRELTKVGHRTTCLVRDRRAQAQGRRR